MLEPAIRRVLGIPVAGLALRELQDEVLRMSPRRDRLGDPQAGDAPHRSGLLGQVGPHGGIVPSEAPGHLHPVGGIERHVGESDLLHPLGEAPGSLVASHQPWSAVPLGGIRASVDASQGVEMDVVGRAQPVCFLVRAGDAQEGLAPVVAPPRLMLGLEGVERELRGGVEFTLGRGQGIAGSGDRSGDDHVIPRRPSVGKEQRRSRALCGAGLRLERRGRHDHCGSAPEHGVIFLVEVVLHPSVGEVRASAARVDLAGMDRVGRMSHLHRRPPLG